MDNMKNLKGLVALVLAMMMTMALVGTAFTEGEDTAGATTTTWRGSKDGSISISGLTKGDSVDFYQVLAYDANAYKTVANASSVTEGAGSWKAVAPFTAITLDEFKAILTTGITAALGGKIGGMATGTAKYANVAADDSGIASVSAPDAGLYVALITSVNPQVVYNPVFVGADYYTNDSGVWAVTADMSYNPAALAKKEEITLTKDVNGTGDTKYDVNVGDDVGFTITSKVPAYSDTYDSPMYELTDTMSSGLVLKGTPSVSIEGVTLVDADYKVTIADNKLSFKVEILEGGLKKVAAKGTAQTITVTYTATVNSIDDYNVNEKDNTATVKFSNNPGDKTKYALLEDRTRNYTFSLDANLLGHSGWENSELVKIGMTPDGQEITQETLSNGTKAGVLAGAEFGLYTNSDCADSHLYNNSVFTTGKVTSDAHGKLHIKGLDAGTYYLKELNSPDGYIKSQDTYEIKIEAVYEDVAGGSYQNSEGITVKYDGYKVLKSYTVTVKNLATNAVVDSDFTITNAGTYNKTITEVKDADETTKIANTRGLELPSTGGIGTTLFYIAGIVMVLGAAAIMVARRKSEQE